MAVQHSLGLATLLIGLALAAESSVGSGTAGSGEAAVDRATSTYQGALHSAQSALQQIQDLHRSVQESMMPSFQKTEKSTELEVEASLGTTRQQLSAHFVQLQKQAAAAAQEANINAANEALSGMEAANRQLETLDMSVEHALDEKSRVLEEHARDKARDAEEQADKLARAARKQTDHLGRVARNFEMPDMSDRLDRLSESAARKVQDAAEKGARVSEDATRNLSKDFRQRQSEATRARHRALETTRELIRAAAAKEQPSAGAAVAPIMSMEEPEHSFEAPVLLVAAASTGALTAGLVTLLFRRCSPDEDEMEKYLLVV